MKHRNRIRAGTGLLLWTIICFPWSWAVAQTEKQEPSKLAKLSVDRPAEAEVVFGKEGKYRAVLLCCWRILVCEQLGDGQAIIWDWKDFDGGTSEKRYFLARDVDGDGNEEVAFQIGRVNSCREENLAVLYSPQKRAASLLMFDGESTLHLSPDLKDNSVAREWLMKYWQERYRADLDKITITYDAKR